MNGIVNFVIIGLGLLSLFLMTKRLFWLVAFCIAGLASAFSTLASIIHFHILGALGFFFLTGICWIATYAIFEKIDS